MAACSGGNNAGSAPAGSGGGDLHGATVTVIGTWTDVEQTNFLAMVKPWEDQTGAKVKYQGTRSINDILAAGIPTGVLPDLAGLPGPVNNKAGFKNCVRSLIKRKAGKDAQQVTCGIALASSGCCFSSLDGLSRREDLHASPHPSPARLRRPCRLRAGGTSRVWSLLEKSV